MTLHTLDLTRDEIEYMLRLMGLSVREFTLKPGDGLTAEGALKLREKLQGFLE